ncbi:uncharacterized protein N7511_010834 [Penicillium nucicola]|uniref:uncharacterized protein n=1 Tax=Penicillium nucicola TaxID=1850975 RepID=UPI002544DC2F|nr:uncharacterized protein N7511_010834 [Penicillium nucicola]KAJ5749138.1 hypothetical protein N7511_010834 [Penicillium nucicola]
MTIESCLQRCLKSPLGQREIPAGFEDPTWTEEQRMLLGFWRFVYWNQLKKDTKNNRLRWFRPDLETLEHWRPYDDCPAALGKQAYTALFYIEDIIAPGVFKSEFDALHSESLELPPLLPEKEFGWKCRPASSSLAITQHWRPSEKFRELTAHEISAQMKRLSSTEQDTLSGLTYVSRPRRFYHASSSSLSDYSSQEEEIDELDEENGEGLDLSVETDDSPQTGRQSRSRPSRPVHCTLTYTTTEADTETQHQSVLTRRHPWNPRPVRKFGPRYKTKDESLDLGRPTLGLQFWRSMSLNPEGGPAQFMWFEGYIRYGFALWEEKRMIDLGLWSDGVIEDMTEFYQRWYYFLDAEDISRYKVKASFFLSDDGDNE